MKLEGSKKNLRPLLHNQILCKVQYDDEILWEIYG